MKFEQKKSLISKCVVGFICIAIIALYLISQLYSNETYYVDVSSIPESNRKSPVTPGRVAPSVEERLFNYEHSDLKTLVHYNRSTSTESIKIEDFFNIANCKIVVCSIGNLGNQIWEYMSLFVVWKKYMRSGYKPYIEESMFQNLKVLFPKLSITPTSEELCDSPDPKSKVIMKDAAINDSWFEVDDNKRCENIYLDRYSSRYEEILEYGLDKIKKEMSLAPDLVADCQNFLLFSKQQYHLENEEVVFVGMHYRGTDYIHHLEINYGISKTPTSKFYVEAMKYFKENYKHVIFILITIDHQWQHQNIRDMVNNTNVVVNPTSGDRLHDLVLLSQCNHSIINYGTFGATAALLAGGTTFVYDLKLPLDHRGSTLAMGIASILPNWHSVD